MCFGKSEKAELKCLFHCGDVKWRPRLPKLPINRMFVQQFVQTGNKETAKVCVAVPLWRESTDDQWIPPTKDSNAKNVSISWRHNGKSFSSNAIITLKLHLKQICRQSRTSILSNIYLGFKSRVFNECFWKRNCICPLCALCLFTDLFK